MLAQSQGFLRAAAERSGRGVDDFARKVCDHRNDPISSRVFRDYGAIFVASENVLVPAKCVFDSTLTTDAFQARLKLTSKRIGNADITLQAEALAALERAIEEASSQRLRITPLDGSIAGLRDYDDTVRLWGTRFYRALTHWERQGKISKAEADAARSLPAYDQVPLVLKWEQQGFWFSTGLNRSILTSVAAPGTSQHLSGLAFDVVEYSNARVRAILNKHGWYQTVLADEPHFTYLGQPESDLPKFGLISRIRNGYKFWIPADR